MSVDFCVKDAAYPAIYGIGGGICFKSTKQLNTFVKKSDLNECLIIYNNIKGRLSCFFYDCDYLKVRCHIDYKHLFLGYPADTSAPKVGVKNVYENTLIKLDRTIR